MAQQETLDPFQAAVLNDKKLQNVKRLIDQALLMPLVHATSMRSPNLQPSCDPSEVCEADLAQVSISEDLPRPPAPCSSYCTDDKTVDYAPVILEDYTHLSSGDLRGRGKSALETSTVFQSTSPQLLSALR